MPIDNYTKDFFKSVKTHLGTIVGRLDTLVGVADRPRQEGVATVKDKDATEQKSYAAIREMFVSLQTGPSPNHSNGPKHKWYRSTKWWKGVKESIEAAALISAIVYAGITYRQWRDAARNFRTDERAWIKIRFPVDASGNAIYPELAQGKPIAIVFSLSNTGKTPSKPVRVEASAVILNADVPVPIEQLDDPNQVFGADTQFGGLFPNDNTAPSVVYRQNRGQALPMTQLEIDTLRRGDQYVAVYGIIRYDDVFGHSHWTKFCNWYSWGIQKYNAWTCSQINGVDDNNE